MLKTHTQNVAIKEISDAFVKQSSNLYSIFNNHVQVFWPHILHFEIPIPPTSSNDSYGMTKEPHLETLTKLNPNDEHTKYLDTQIHTNIYILILRKQARMNNISYLDSMTIYMGKRYTHTTRILTCSNGYLNNIGKNKC
jgi:hypothetical protein